MLRDPVFAGPLGAAPRSVPPHERYPHGACSSRGRKTSRPMPPRWDWKPGVLLLAAAGAPEADQAAAAHPALSDVAAAQESGGSQGLV